MEPTSKTTILNNEKWLISVGFPWIFRFSLVNRQPQEPNVPDWYLAESLTGLRGDSEFKSEVNTPKKCSSKEKKIQGRVGEKGYYWHLNPSSCQVLSRNCVGISYVITYCFFGGEGILVGKVVISL